MKKYNLAFLGSGAMGTEVIDYVISNLKDKFNIALIMDNEINNAEKLSSKYNISPVITNDINILLEMKDIDLIIETASVQAANQYANDLVKKTNVVFASVGAMSDQVFYNNLLDDAAKNNNTIIIPPGAIGGLDAIGAVKDSITFIEIITTKSPESLSGAKGFSDYENYNFTSPQIIFKGSATNAIKLFPKNLNVAVTLSLFGLGPDKTNVTVIADPDVKMNCHKINLKGQFGEMSFDFKLEKSIKNPRTSALAGLSIMKILKDY
jgi:aspartate dehydrogenase